METNVKTDKKGKKARKHEVEAEAPAVDTPTVGDVVAEGAAGKGTGAPRPRKWDYGIIPEAQIVRQAAEASVKKEVAEAWGYTDDNPTVAEYTKRGGDRHGLRVLSRRGLIKIVHPDGTEFPREYVKAEKPEATEGGETAE
jgi:hypothetical protein